LCSTKYRSVSRRPEEIRFDVYPKNIVVPWPDSGSFQARCHVLARWPSFMHRVLLDPAKSFHKSLTHGYAPIVLRIHPALEPRTRARTTHHVVDDAHCFSDRCCLEAHGCIAADQLLDRDAARRIVVEVDALHLARTFRDGRGWLQHSICGAGWCRAVVGGRHDVCSQCAEGMGF
jgi:hypothetical protein